MLSNKESGIFQPIVDSWYDSIKNPQRHQKSVLLDLVEGYNRTRYGKCCQSSTVEDIEDFQSSFPITDYKKLFPYLTLVKKGDYNALLPEPFTYWVMTRGSTGSAKVLPVTKTHLNQIFLCGARALINYALKKKDYKILNGKILNLNFPSNVRSMVINNEKITYGYSSGTYAKANPMFNRVSLLPQQEEIDALGPGLSKADWEKRFELAYQQALSENITAAMGVTPVILSFARYVNNKHRMKPESLWSLRALFCTSVPRIQFRYAPLLKKYFGSIPTIEIYSATEGVFGQQLDELPYITPNYDKYFFEVETDKETKMLCELERGEWGKLIVSTCLFPRYDMGDIIEAAGKNYFRVIGRDTSWNRIRTSLYKQFFGWFL